MIFVDLRVDRGTAEPLGDSSSQQSPSLYDADDTSQPIANRKKPFPKWIAVRSGLCFVKMHNCKRESVPG
jgi:hypothetical protein